MAEVLKIAKAWLGGQQEPKAKAKLGAPTRAVNAYHAVTITPGERSCEAAQKLLNQRFLSRDAPPLPLKQCTQRACDCHYQHHKDRRKGPRRANEMGIAIDGHEGSDQRTGKKRGRRKGDPIP